MNVRILALALVLTLTLPTALGAEGSNLFPNVHDVYPGHVDVSGESWFLEAVEACYLTGLMTGKGDGTFFDPEGTVTVAEAVAVAARVGSILRGETLPPSSDGTWYGGAAAYLRGLPGGEEVVSGNLEQFNILRKGVFQYLNIAVPKDALSPINSVTSLPDSDDPAVLRFYNAGILSGVDEYGTFAGERTLTRAELAAMVARIARPELALTVNLKAPQSSADALPSLDTVVITGTHTISGDTYSITWEAFSPQFVAAGMVLKEACELQGVAFSWDNSIGETAFIDYAVNHAANLAISALWSSQLAAQADSQVWKAKHILVDTQAEADALRTQLKAAGDNQTLFTQLMEAHSTDLGSKSQPEGYVFVSGQMVEPFETGTKNLPVGAVSDPVKSEFGYHIIFRLPVSEEEAYAAWRESCRFSFAVELSPPTLTSYFDATVLQ